MLHGLKIKDENNMERMLDLFNISTHPHSAPNTMAVAQSLDKPGYQQFQI